MVNSRNRGKEGDLKKLIKASTVGSKIQIGLKFTRKIMIS